MCAQGYRDHRESPRGRLGPPPASTQVVAPANRAVLSTSKARSVECKSVLDGWLAPPVQARTSFWLGGSQRKHGMSPVRSRSCPSEDDFVERVRRSWPCLRHRVCCDPSKRVVSPARRSISQVPHSEARRYDVCGPAKQPACHGRRTRRQSMPLNWSQRPAQNGIMKSSE